MRSSGLPQFLQLCLSAALLLAFTARPGGVLAQPPADAPSAGLAHEAAPRRERVYLTQLSFVLEGARRVLLFGEAHASEPEMARFLYPLSAQYVELASKMTPGERLQLVHPHLLIVVENVERAVNAAAHQHLQAFRQHVRTIREELATLEAVLKHLKVRLPEPAR